MKHSIKMRFPLGKSKTNESPERKKKLSSLAILF